MKAGILLGYFTQQQMTQDSWTLVEITFKIKGNRVQLPISALMETPYFP